MARAPSKSGGRKSTGGRKGAGSRKSTGRKSTGGRKSAGSRKSTGRKTSSKRGTLTTRASARAKGVRKSSAGKTPASRTPSRKTVGSRASARKTSARGSSSRGKVSTARPTRSTAKKTARSPAQRGRKSPKNQIWGQQTAETGNNEGLGIERQRGSEVEGEGSYTASRHFRSAQTDFVNRNRPKIASMGKDAEAALEGPEGDELRRAEEEARSHAAGNDSEE